MRPFVLCISLLFISFVSQAQTTIASLNITLTDVQSVTFGSAALNELDPDKKEASQVVALKVLSNSTSQIRRISSTNSEYEKLYKEFYAGKANNTLAVNSTSSTERPRGSKSSNLVIYQIDPR
jgi:hypothetical protein